MKNLLLTGAFSYTDAEKKVIQDLGFDIDFLKFEKDDIQTPEKYDAVVCNGLFLSHSIEKFKNLSFIQLTSAGLDRVPLDYIKQNDIKISNARGVYSIPIAEHTVLKILEIYRKSKTFYQNQEKAEWSKERDLPELYGKTVAIIGCGSVGMEVAKRLSAFDANIIGVDITKPESEYVDGFVHTDNLKEVLEICDIAVLTLPLTDATYHLFNKDCFSVMKSTSILINISRGGVIYQPDLVNALKNKEIAGAALDVFKNEPLDNKNELWSMDNVVITPHNSFVGEGNHKRMFDVIYKNLKEWIIDNE